MQTAKTHEIKEVTGTTVWINMGFKRTNWQITSSPECDFPFLPIFISKTYSYTNNICMAHLRAE
jgi:hypothetical protein